MNYNRKSDFFPDKSLKTAAYGLLIVPHPAHLNLHLENGALDGLNHHIKAEMFSLCILSSGK